MYLTYLEYSNQCLQDVCQSCKNCKIVSSLNVCGKTCMFSHVKSCALYEICATLVLTNQIGLITPLKSASSDLQSF